MHQPGAVDAVAAEPAPEVRRADERPRHREGVVVASSASLRHPARVAGRVEVGRLVGRDDAGPLPLLLDDEDLLADGQRGDPLGLLARARGGPDLAQVALTCAILPGDHLARRRTAPAARRTAPRRPATTHRRGRARRRSRSRRRATAAARTPTCDSSMQPTETPRPCSRATRASSRAGVMPPALASLRFTRSAASWRISSTRSSRSKIDSSAISGVSTWRRT